MDGYATMRACASCPRASEIPLVAFTAKVEAGERQRCIDAGASAYVAKPVDTAQLLLALGEWLPAAGAPAARKTRSLMATRPAPAVPRMTRAPAGEALGEISAPGDPGR